MTEWLTLAVFWPIAIALGLSYAFFPEGGWMFFSAAYKLSLAFTFYRIVAIPFLESFKVWWSHE